MTEKSETKRLRSPSYPSLTLERAIELADKFYKKETKHKATPYVAIEHLGYSERSSLGMRALAALVSFGLLEASGLGDDRRVWVSDLGRKILLDRRENSVERMRAIQEAALSPSIYCQLWEEWGGSFPSDLNIKTTLLNLDFNETAIDAFIRQMKDTFEFAKLAGSDILSRVVVDEGVVDGKIREADSPIFTRRQIVYPQEVEKRELIIPLPTGDQAVLTYPFPMDDETFEYLGQFFNMAKRGMTFSAKTRKDAASPHGNELSRDQPIEPEA